MVVFYWILFILETQPNLAESFLKGDMRKILDLWIIFVL